MYVCMYVCMYVFIKLHITTQSGPVILVSMYVCNVCMFGGEGGGDVTNLSPFWEGTARKYPLPGMYFPSPLMK